MLMHVASCYYKSAFVSQRMLFQSVSYSFILFLIFMWSYINIIVDWPILTAQDFPVDKTTAATYTDICNIVQFASVFIQLEAYRSSLTILDYYWLFILLWLTYCIRHHQTTQSIKRQQQPVQICTVYIQLNAAG